MILIHYITAVTVFACFSASDCDFSVLYFTLPSKILKFTSPVEDKTLTLDISNDTKLDKNKFIDSTKLYLKTKYNLTPTEKIEVNTLILTIADNSVTNKAEYFTDYTNIKYIKYVFSTNNIVNDFNVYIKNIIPNFQITEAFNYLLIIIPIVIIIIFILFFFLLRK